MSRQGYWSRVWTEFWKSFSRSPAKNYVGEDQFGNKFYEFVKGARGINVQRGIEPAPGGKAQPPPLEWQQWVKAARRFPPSEEEIRLNRMRQQAQLEQDMEVEKKAPRIESQGLGAADMDRKWKQSGSGSYPKYEENDFETEPGAKRQNQMREDERV